MDKYYTIIWENPENRKMETFTVFGNMHLAQEVAHQVLAKNPTTGYAKLGVFRELMTIQGTENDHPQQTI